MPRRSETKGIYSSQVAPGFTLWAIPGSSYKFQSFIDNSVVYQCQEEINPTNNYFCIWSLRGFGTWLYESPSASPSSETGFRKRSSRHKTANAVVACRSNDFLSGCAANPKNFWKSLPAPSAISQPVRQRALQQDFQVSHLGCASYRNFNHSCHAPNFTPVYQIVSTSTILKLMLCAFCVSARHFQVDLCTYPTRSIQDQREKRTHGFISDILWCLNAY